MYVNRDILIKALIFKPTYYEIIYFYVYYFNVTLIRAVSSGRDHDTRRNKTFNRIYSNYKLIAEVTKNKYDLLVSKYSQCDRSLRIII